MDPGMKKEIREKAMFSVGKLKQMETKKVMRNTNKQTPKHSLFCHFVSLTLKKHRTTQGKKENPKTK